MFQQGRFFNKMLYLFSSFSYRLDNFWQDSKKIMFQDFEQGIMINVFVFSINQTDFVQLSILDHKEKRNGSHSRSPSGIPLWWDRPRTTRHSKAHALVTGRNADNHCGPSNGIEFKWFPTPPPAFGNENGNLNVENWLLVVVGNIKAI